MDFPGRDILSQAMRGYRKVAALERLRRALEQLAREKGGETVRDDYTDQLPRVRMDGPDAVRWLSLSRGSKGHLKVGLVHRWLLEESRMAELPSVELHPIWRSRDYSVPWMRPVHAGDTVLDARFAVYSEEGRSVTHVFTRDVSTALLALHYAFDVAGADFTLGGRCVVLRKLVKADQISAALLSKVLERMDQICVAVEDVFRIESEGILKILEERDGSGTAESRCRVCGEPLADQPALACAACDTPHHSDCWQYTGRCAIFGCGSRRFVTISASGKGRPARRPPTLVIG